MKILTLVLLIFASAISLADELKVEINPSKPVAGEVFQAYFRIFTESDEEPVINFSPSGVEVVGKSNQGVSTRTIYANGKLSVSREMTFVYDLVANRTGLAGLRDITARLGTQTLRHSSLSFQVIKEPELAPDVFIKAEIPTENLFVGQGIMVRYFIYHKVQLSNFDVKKYPKLDNFLKRFLQEPDRAERVSVDGQVYLRSLIYAAKIFPEKPGQLKVDSLYASVTYAATRAGDPFGAFGLSRDFKTKSISSEAIKVNVRPLPEPVPENFTGLIGKHEIQLEFGSTKLIVNQPLEAKLTISGGGALENVEAPTIIRHQGLEEFETNGDLKINNPEHATKTFNYTYLAKENLKLPAGQVTLTYFDPGSERYVPVTLNVPEIVVAGGEISDKREAKPEQPATEPREATKVLAKASDFAAPVISGTSKLRELLPYVNLGLGICAIVIALSWGLRKKLDITLRKEYRSIPSSLKGREFSLSDFTKWLSPVIEKSGKSPLAIIRDSDLDEETKAYFSSLILEQEKYLFSANKGTNNYKYVAKNFKNLQRYIERTGHENHTQS